ncbi:hypothetical protein KR222_011203 [Zaprionus bogoriensis]|nr:hypothetical protein KR222_011203 [Zaprionus bogoriensis]
MPEVIQLAGVLSGHSGWVTQVAPHPYDPDLLVSSSRDKTIIVWRLTRDSLNSYGHMLKRNYGHSHFISDVVLSSDGNFALSGSWDRTVRLWDLTASATTQRFEGHSKDVLSVAFSPDNRQIVSGSRDRTIKLWNTLADCKYTINEDCHSDWVSCVRFSPKHSNPLIVSCGWDRTVKVWDLTHCKLRNNHHGHSGYLTTVAVSPDGSLCTSGGKDAKVLFWDLSDGRNLYPLDHHDVVNAMSFSPNRYWLCVACGSSIVVWDLASKKAVYDLWLEDVPATAKGDLPQCLSLAWSIDGQTLFAGYSDAKVRAWQVLSGQ